MITPYTYSSVSNSPIITSFKKDNKKKFKCPRHGWIKGWVFFRKFRKRRNIYSTDHRILKRLDKKEIKSRKRVGYYDYYIKCPECSYEYEKQLYKSQPIKAVLRSSKKHAHNKNIPCNLLKEHHQK